AAEFYRERLAGPDAEVGRQFLTERGFDEAAAAHFGVGFAPQGWDALTNHLRGRKFTDQELLAGGLVSQGQRGVYDRFRGRLVWPIRDITGDVVGFGARRLLEEDNGPKYLNTPETPIYRKSTVLYGVDLAKRDIARRMQAVVVEGYTDVMACHLAGVETAIATCGTAFGEDHVKVLRRLLMDQNEFRGEVVFTFDGDLAGQKAADRAFKDHDQRFVTQTFVAVEPSGMDPCELRQAKGDTAVRDLVARRLPLFEFAIRSSVGGYDLETAEGRGAATRAGMEVVRRIRDVSLRTDYARQLSGWIGLPNPDELVAAARGGVADARRSSRSAPAAPSASDPATAIERGVLKVVLQAPELAGATFDALDASVFTAPAYAAVRDAVASAGGAAAAEGGGPAWVTRVAEQGADDAVRRLVRELAVEPIPSDDQAQTRYATEVLARLEASAVTRRVTDVKSRLQRMNPVEVEPAYNRLFGELIALEAHLRALRERAIGTI
ncbi:MAG: toprim domain-containing protein, partial [Actinomycetes bacterium]